VAALNFLALGDTAAALVGVAFGGDTIRLGPAKEKSHEGSVAMFVVCFSTLHRLL
jgi:dolichol kinase